MIFKKFYVCILIIAFITMFFCNTAYSINEPKKNVLLLNSYHKGYEWTDEIVEGIESILGDDSSVNLETEYMDFKKNNSEEYLMKLYELYKLKYSSRLYDVIIATDNEALDFLLDYRDSIFSEVPIVFCGVNNYKSYHINQNDKYTGVSKEIEIEDNINIILQLHPKAEKIVAVIDKTVSGDAIEKMLEESLNNLGSRIEYRIIKEAYVDEIINQVKNLDNRTILFYGVSVLKDVNEVQLSLIESFEEVKKAISSDVPIYSSWELLLGYGIIGGKLSSGFNEGCEVANMAKRILNGENVENIQIVKQVSSQYMFDYKQLNKHNISQKTLPAGSVFINKPSAFYPIEKSIAWIAMLIAFIVLTISNLILMANIRRRRCAEAALSESEENLRTLMNGMPDIICFKDGQGRWMEANHAILKFFGLANVNYKGKTDEELSKVHSSLSEPLLNSANTDELVWEAKASRHFEEVIVTGRKLVKTFDIVKVPIFYKDGSRKGIIMIGRDISQRNLAEAALHRKEEILRATLNATADGVLVVSNDRKIIDYNELFLKMWRVPKQLIDTYHESTFLEYVSKQLKEAAVFKKWVDDCYFITQSDFLIVYFEDGRVYEIFSEPLVKKDRIEGRVWSFRDITQRKLIEKELSESEERYRRLVELSPDAIYMSVDGNNIYANSAGAKLLGVGDSKELIGKPILGFVYYDYYDSTNNRIKSNHDEKMVLPLIEEKLIKRDGSIVDIEVASTSFEYKGKTALLSVVRDITERKKAEELRKRVEENSRLLLEALEYDKLKTEFFANISHEFRTPLNIILGAQQLFDYVLKNELTGETKIKIDKYLKIMKQNCYRLLRLVNNLIDITRIDAGFFNIQLQNSNIVNIVEEITLSVAEYIENKGISLQFDTDVEEKIIACDPDKIERIILNLLSNATKFTEAGERIDVIMEDKDDWVLIVVKDTGIGIPKDKHDIIFERFRQVDKSFVRNHEGSGIGLSIVKSLVELHGGRVSLDSKWEVGTKFIIMLPAKVLEEEETCYRPDSTYQSKIERINVEFSDIYL